MSEVIAVVCHFVLIEVKWYFLKQNLISLENWDECILYFSTSPSIADSFLLFKDVPKYFGLHC